MKKFTAAFIVITLSLITLSSKIHATDPNQAIADQLSAKGFKNLKHVYTQLDSFYDLDKDRKQIQHPSKQTVTIDLQYNSIKEANSDYGNVISELTGKNQYYKGQVGANYLKVNIYKGDQLVAYYFIGDNGERMYDIMPGTTLSNIGMGFPMSHNAYLAQLQLIQKANDENL